VGNQAMPMGKNSNQLPSKDKTNQYILISLTIISAFLAFLFWRSPLTVYDAAGHVSLVRTIASDLWPKMAGWNAHELLGWPQGVFYPTLFHWLAATVSFLVGVPVAIKVLISAALILLPFSINLFTRSLIDNKFWVATTTLVLFLSILLFPNFLGTGVRALFQIGLLSNFFVLPLLFFFLAALHRKSSYLLVGLLLALIVLTHLVAAIVAGVYLAVFMTLTRSHLVNYLKVWGLTAVLTSFFWIPFVLNLQYTSVSRHVSSYFLPNIAAFAGLLIISLHAWRKKEVNMVTLGAVAGFFALLAVIDAFLIRSSGTSFALYPFHIYRFQPFAYLLLVAAIMVQISKYIKFDKWGLMIRGVLFGGLGLVVLILLANNPSQIPNAKLELTDLEVVKGRFIETFRRTESDPFWYGLQTEVNAENQKASWSYGLFTDSSPNGPYLGSLIKSFKPEAYLEGEGAFIETKLINEEKAGQLLAFFSVNQLINLEDTEKKSIGSLEKGEKRQFFNLEKASESRLFEVTLLPLKPVKNNWRKEVEKWWTQEGQLSEIPYLANGREVSNVSENDLQSAEIEIVDVNEKQTRFKLKVNSEKEVPILAKIPYFPYWKAFQEGEEIPVYRTAPNLMLFEAKGDVMLIYDEPGWINWLYIISFAAFLVTIFLIYRQKIGSK